MEPEKSESDISLKERRKSKQSRKKMAKKYNEAYKKNPGYNDLRESFLAIKITNGESADNDSLQVSEWLNNVGPICLDGLKREALQKKGLCLSYSDEKWYDYQRRLFSLCQSWIKDLIKRETNMESRFYFDVFLDDLIKIYGALKDHPEEAMFVDFSGEKTKQTNRDVVKSHAIAINTLALGAHKERGEELDRLRTQPRYQLSEDCKAIFIQALGEETWKKTLERQFAFAPNLSRVYFFKLCSRDLKEWFEKKIKKMGVKEFNVEYIKVAKECWRMVIKVNPSLKSGETCVVSGLKNGAQYNGCKVTVLGFIPRRLRYKVKVNTLPEKNKKLSVRHDCLSLVGSGK